MKFNNILFLFASVVSAAYKIKILETSIFHFFPSLKLHHVVIIEDSGSVGAIDFTPIDQRKLKTIGKLFLGFNVPAQIRIVPITDVEFNDNIGLIKKWEKNSQIDNIDLKNKKLIELLKDWKNDSMNLYCHNCQHFSHFLRKRITTDS